MSYQIPALCVCVCVCVCARARIFTVFESRLDANGALVKQVQTSCLIVSAASTVTGVITPDDLAWFYNVSVWQTAWRHN